MTKTLLDTNVLSELVRPRPEPKVQAFVHGQTDPLISALTIHELVFGAERARDQARRTKLLSWIAAIRNQFAGRIVDVDADIAEQAGRLRAGAAFQGADTDPMDALIAACAVSKGASIATRNISDFALFGVTIVDPWATLGRRPLSLNLTVPEPHSISQTSRIAANAHDPNREWRSLV